MKLEARIRREVERLRAFTASADAADINVRYALAQACDKLCIAADHEHVAQRLAAEQAAAVLAEIAATSGTNRAQVRAFVKGNR